MVRASAKDREVRSIEERHKDEIARLEMLLKDRENISMHAKEMWM